MPKLHTINILVEEVAVGYVMRVLNTTPGVAKINYDMDGFHATPNKPNGSKRPYTPRASGRYEIKGDDLLVKLLAKKPMVSGALRQAFEGAGRSGASISSIIHRLKQAGDIEYVDGQGYVLTRKMKDRLRHRKANKEA